jgi:hypothetical protein
MAEAIFEDMHSQRLDAFANDSEATMRAMRPGMHADGAVSADTAHIKHHAVRPRPEAHQRSRTVAPPASTRSSRCARRAIPENVRVTGLTDLGFGDPVRDALLETLASSSVIRFHGAIRVEHEDQQKPAPSGLLRTALCASSTARASVCPRCETRGSRG